MSNGIVAHFKRLGAPLTGQYRWGGVKADGTVILSVWQDEWKKGRVLIKRADGSDSGNKAARNERLDHIEMIRNGAKCELVMAVSDNGGRGDNGPCGASAINKRELFTTNGEIEMFPNGDLYIVVTGRRPV